jgi:hypothetical protein
MHWLYLIILALATAAIGSYALQWWRRRRRLDALAHRHHMHRPKGGEFETVLRTLPEHWAGTGLRDILVGTDGSGRYFSARKGWGGDMREVFLVELSQHTPARGLQLESRHKKSDATSLHMGWNLTPEQALDATAREVVQRVLREFAAFKMHHPKLPISLEVGDKSAVLYAPAAGEEQRMRFIAAARVLRGDLVHCLFRRASISTNPASSSKPKQAEPELVPEEVHPDIERALDSLEAEPVVSAKELLAEKPPPPKKGWQRVNGKEVFQIPEPEDKVVVLSASASHTKAVKPIKGVDSEKSKFFLP